MSLNRYLNTDGLLNSVIFFKQLPYVSASFIKHYLNLGGYFYFSCLLLHCAVLVMFSIISQVFLSQLTYTLSRYKPVLE